MPTLQSDPLEVKLQNVQQLQYLTLSFWKGIARIYQHMASLFL